MDVFSLAVNLVNENAILAECLCIEITAEYLYKVKYFKINTGKNYRLLGSAFVIVVGSISHLPFVSQLVG